MSRHDGVSCDSCMKSSFRGRRYKCLICYDYDLCAECHDRGATTSRHTKDHAMQCMITRNDYELFFYGEALSSDQPQSFSCPFCGRKGFLEATLQDHITSEHSDTTTEVVCPICASQPGGEPNHVTDDFATHLTIDHPTPRDFDEPTGMRHVSRLPHTNRGRGSRVRRGNINFPSSMNSGGRETMDPIAELLSQLSSVRSRAVAAQSVSSQLQQLEQQLQSTRQQLERLPRRPTDAYSAVAAKPAGNTAASTATGGFTSTSDKSSGVNISHVNDSKLLLSRCLNATGTPEGPTSVDAAPGLFVHEIILSTLVASLPEVSKDHQSNAVSDIPDRSVDSDVEGQAKTLPTSPLTVVDHRRISNVNTTSRDRASADLTSVVLKPIDLEHDSVLAVSGNRHQQRSATAGCMGFGQTAAVRIVPRHTCTYPERHCTTVRDQRLTNTTHKRNMLKHVDSSKKNEPPH